MNKIMITGRNNEDVLNEIYSLHKSYVQRKEEILNEHKKQTNGISKLIILFYEKLETIDVNQSPFEFYENFMYTKVLGLIYLTYTNKISEPNTYSYDDFKVDVLNGVFSPEFASDSYLWAKYFIEKGLVKDKIVLEMGAGSGIIALYLAKYGHPKKITAVDINPFAIENLKHNISKLNLENEVEVIESNLYKNVPSDNFDIIYWAYVWICLTDEKMIQVFEEEKDPVVKRLMGSVIDPHYNMLEKFLEKSIDKLSTNGKIFIIGSDFLPNDKIVAIASKLNLNVSFDKFTSNEDVVKGVEFVLNLYNITFTKNE